MTVEMTFTGNEAVMLYQLISNSKKYSEMRLTDINNQLSKLEADNNSLEEYSLAQFCVNTLQLLKRNREEEIKVCVAILNKLS